MSSTVPEILNPEAEQLHPPSPLRPSSPPVNLEQPKSGLFSLEKLQSVITTLIDVKNAVNQSKLSGEVDASNQPSEPASPADTTLSTPKTGHIHLDTLANIVTTLLELKHSAEEQERETPHTANSHAVIDSDDSNALHTKIHTLTSDNARLAASHDQVAKEKAALQQRLVHMQNAFIQVTQHTQHLQDEHAFALKTEITTLQAEMQACRALIDVLQERVGEVQRSAVSRTAEVEDKVEKLRQSIQGDQDRVSSLAVPAMGTGRAKDRQLSNASSVGFEHLVSQASQPR